MSDRPIWSVIVPTYQREKVLCETIEYLLGLSYPHYELLVIDQTRRHEKETEQFLRACETPVSAAISLAFCRQGQSAPRAKCGRGDGKR